jgi:tripartite-type tricarboxylate transporter receptor subunit TctC
MRPIFFLKVIACLVLATGISLAQAQTYPSQSIRLIVPWPPGGATDVIARLMAQALSPRLGQTVVVENKPGAGGNIGTEQFVRSKPDGYTIIMATSSTNAANPHLYARLGFDPVKDFAPVVFVASVPNILVVPAASPARTALELIAEAKANPGKLTYGSAGIGASQHLAGALFKNITKIDVLHVPYKGSGPAAADLMAGHISMMLDTGSLPHIAGGRLRALAVASKTRLPALPDVPTFEELGVRGMIASAWYGLMAPAGTPSAIIDRLNRDSNAVLQSADFRQRLTDFGAEIGGGTAEEFAAFAIAEIKHYEEIVALSGAKMEE